MAHQRVALVTGGNRGIGLEVCRRLAEGGARVFLGARDLAKGRAAAERLGLSGVTPVALDVTAPDTIAGAVAGILAQAGRLDILVNNAGIFIEKSDGVYASALDVAPELVARTYETNVLGPLRLIQAVVPAMRRQTYGRIVNVSSMMGQLAGMGGSAVGYRSSKAALNAVTRVVAAELGQGNIKINAMHPGWVRTDMGGPQAPVSPEDAADTAIYLATLPDDGPTGGFFERRKPIAW
jgi:NAD(P)-dependent dehydrogenase (short-subunit alcohol dehydrogenase family)